MPRQLSIEWLRTLVVVSEFGSIASAARRLGRPPGSLGFHIRRMEDEIGAAVYRRGRSGVVLTEAGSLLLDYARQLLELHDDALESILALKLKGAVRFGIPEDVEAQITPLLARFSRLHIGVSIETRVDRSPALIKAVERGELDLALAFAEASGDALVDGYKLAWLGAAETDLAGERPLPLVLLERPCLFRDAALFTLEEAGIPWRIVLTGPGLSSLWSAVRAGLGVTVRIATATPPGIVALDGLPQLPPLRLEIFGSSGDALPAARRLCDWIMRYFNGNVTAQSVKGNKF